MRPRGKKLGFSYRFAVSILRPFMRAFTKHEWQGIEHLQADILPDGSQVGIVVCPNHISAFDPLSSSHFLYENGRPPRYLAKASIFNVPVVGGILRRAGQIPVYRESLDAAAAVKDAVSAAQRGECVVVYPEGTITRDPDLWPMKGKTGAARIALTSGAPVIPVAQWGAQEVMPPYAKERHLLPRKTMRVKAGPPVDLDDLRAQPLDNAVLAEATDRILAALTSLLEDLRGETAPAERYDVRKRRAGSAATEASDDEGAQD